MSILALITYLIWDVDLGIFRMMHFAFLNKRPTLGAPNRELWEWYFRTALDHWSTFLGMIFAADLLIVFVHGFILLGSIFHMLVY